MPKLINKNDEEQETEQKRRKLEGIIKEEIKGTELKVCDTSYRSWTEFRIYKEKYTQPFSWFGRKKVMKVGESVFLVHIDLKDNSYMELAKRLGENIEKNYETEKTEVQIRYRKGFCGGGSVGVA